MKKIVVVFIVMYVKEKEKKNNEGCAVEDERKV